MRLRPELVVLVALGCKAPPKGDSGDLPHTDDPRDTEASAADAEEGVLAAAHRQRWRQASAFDGCVAGITAEGEAMVWGPYCDHYLYNTPKQALREVSMGSNYACAVSIEGETLCWGRDEKGWTQNDPPPGAFHGIAAGLAQTCALDEESRVVCWGYNRSPDWLWPRDTAASQVGAGYVLQCALGESRSIQCWGNQHWVVEPDGDDYVEIAVGWYHVCGRTTKGTVRCAGSYDPAYPVPSPPENLRFKEISAGFDTLCGILDTGAIECWSSGDDYTMVLVHDKPDYPVNFNSLDLGAGCACALDTRGYASCWGDSWDRCVPPTP